MLFASDKISVVVLLDALSRLDASGKSRRKKVLGKRDLYKGIPKQNYRAE